MNTSELVKSVYNAIDKRDPETFANFMTHDGIFRFANIPAVQGKEAIRDFVDQFFKSIKGIRHSDLEHWVDDTAIFVNGNVHYTRHDDSVLSVPFSVTWKMNKEKIHEYLIFIDNSELYN